MKPRTNDSIRDPKIAAVRFQPQQLSRARELKNYTKTALADMIGKTPSAISQFESGTVRPDAQTVASLAIALGMPIGFFAKASTHSRIRFDECHFRSLRSVSQGLRRQAIRTGELVHELISFLEFQGIQLPSEQVSSCKQRIETSEDIELCANNVRELWGLGTGPIPNLIPLVESMGVRIVPLRELSKDVDAFSTWYQGYPYIILGTQKPASRIHFDIAHEIGHLVMHEDVAPGNPAAESEAHQFAGAFLLPRESFLAECPTRWSFSTFRALKRRWSVSIQALVVRAHKLGRLSTSSYRRAFAELNRKKMKLSECDEWEMDKPEVLKEAIALVDGEFSKADLAEALDIHEAYLFDDLLAPVL